LVCTRRSSASSRREAVAEVDHLAELPRGVDVQQREGQRRGREGLEREARITAESLPME
jgi:hypothetical protein